MYEKSNKNYKILHFITYFRIISLKIQINNTNDYPKKTQIKEEIKKLILSDNNLMIELADYLNIRVYNLPQTLRRNSKTTTQVDTIQFLSKLLNKNINEILAEAIDKEAPLTFIKNEINIKNKTK